MLGTGARYAEYGITGGFFLFTQALILGLAYPDVLVADSDDLARVYRFDLAQDSEMISPTIPI
jgi:hypothetical protein